MLMAASRMMGGSQGGGEKEIVLRCVAYVNTRPALLHGVFGLQAWIARLALEQQKAA